MVINSDEIILESTDKQYWEFIRLLKKNEKEQKEFVTTIMLKVEDKGHSAIYTCSTVYFSYCVGNANSACMLTRRPN